MNKKFAKVWDTFFNMEYSKDKAVNDENTNLSGYLCLKKKKVGAKK